MSDLKNVTLQIDADCPKCEGGTKQTPGEPCKRCKQTGRIRGTVSLEEYVRLMQAERAKLHPAANADIPITALDLGVRAFYGLHWRARIHTLGQLTRKSAPELLAIQGFGAVCLKNVRDALASIGLFRDGGPPSVSVFVEAPANNIMPLFADGFESGGTGAWTLVMP